MTLGIGRYFRPQKTLTITEKNDVSPKINPSHLRDTVKVNRPHPRRNVLLLDPSYRSRVYNHKLQP